MNAVANENRVVTRSPFEKKERTLNSINSISVIIQSQKKRRRILLANFFVRVTGIRIKSPHTRTQASGVEVLNQLPPHNQPELGEVTSLRKLRDDCGERERESSFLKESLGEF